MKIKVTSGAPSEQPEEGAPAADAGVVVEIDPCAEVRQQLDAAKAQANDYLDQWRRTAADFQNYKKRVERENAEQTRSAAAGFVGRLLPVIDDLDLAFAHLPEELKGNGWVSGVDLMRQKLMLLLEQENVREIEVNDASFDPSQHEAITYEAHSDLADGQVIGVVRKGYRMGERVLRPAQVRVARSQDEA